MGWTMLMHRATMASALLLGLCLSVPLVSAQTATPTPPATTQTPPAAAPSTPAAPAPSTPAAPTPAPAAPATPAPSAPAATPAPTTPAPTAPTPAAPPADTGNAGPDKTGPDTSISQTFELQPRPVLALNGKSTWDEGFKSINDSFAKLADTLGKTDAKATGFPTAIFTQTDDAGFTFDAMIPVDKIPEGKPDLAAGVSFGMSPGGKVMKFQHRAAYDDIDSTYEAITAYLDEKGLEAKNMFAEEYIKRTKTSDDPSLEVDILVFLK